MKDYQRVLITAALPYANGPLHIGHLAGNFLPADVYFRFQKLKGQEALFICGSDEHGVPITITADQQQTTPQAVADKYHELIKSSLALMRIDFSHYSRTSSDIHKETSKAFFKKLYDDGFFEEKTTLQFYDEKSKIFLADRYIQGTCPKCGNESAYGDQCEKCGSTLSPQELINPKSTLNKQALTEKETKHWFLPLSQFEPWLEKWILEEHASDWKPNVLGQCKSWLDGGLKARAMTRDSYWGVPVPLPNADGKVLYVWFDAPIGYISATKEYTENWQKYWKQDDTKLVHFIGKDNIVFHCVIFPAMLKAHGDYILPDNVPANEFLNIEGRKVSTSRNWAVWVHEYLEDLPDGVDMLRYVLISNAPEQKDNDFTWKDFQERINNELVAIYGNFVNRTMVLMHKLCNGRVPRWHKDQATPADKKISKCILSYKKMIEQSVEKYRNKEALSKVIDLARQGNKYMQDVAPWLITKRLEKEPEAQKIIDNCIYNCLQMVANLAILGQPFLPTTSEKICHLLKVTHKMLAWEHAGRMDLVKTNYPLRAPELLFQKIDDGFIENQIQKLHKNQIMKSSPTQLKSTPEESYIDFEDFTKVALKIGNVLTCKKVPKADTLLHLEIEIGNEVRTILSGIAKHYTPEEVVGRQVVVVTNLKPRKMRGIESQGMVLMTENENKGLVFVSPIGTVPTGSVVS